MSVQDPVPRLALPRQLDVRASRVYGGWRKRPGSVAGNTRLTWREPILIGKLLKSFRAPYL